jgi:excisionase family DNA binding protein
LEQQLLTTKQVAELLQVATDTVRRWRYAGKIPFVRLGHRTVRYRREDVQKLSKGSKSDGRSN